jgi:hypothetical protein
MQKSYVHWPLAVDEARAAVEREPKIA